MNEPGGSHHLSNCGFCLVQVGDQPVISIRWSHTLTFASVGGDCAQYAFSDAWFIVLWVEKKIEDF